MKFASHLRDDSIPKVSMPTARGSSVLERLIYNFPIARFFHPRFLSLSGLISATVKHFAVLIESTRCL